MVEAEGVLLNGSVLGPVGQAAVSLMAHQRGAPIIVLCHTFKFCNVDLTDSLDNNELGKFLFLYRNDYIYLNILYIIINCLFNSLINNFFFFFRK